MPESPTGVLMPDETLSDETLVQRSRGGDAGAREELFRRHFGTAYRVAHRLLGHEQDALDAVQEAFLKAITHLHAFNGRSTFKTWLLVIVNNAALDAGRRRGRRSARSREESEARGIEPSREDDPAHDLYREDLRRTIDAALNRLSSPLRAVFVLYAEGGLSYKEIAEALEIPQGTVMSRIFAARQKLQSLIDLDQIEGI